MSDRRNAARYTGAPDIGFPTTPQGGTGLLSLLTGNDPKSLLKQSQGFTSQENEKGRQHETELNAALAKFQLDQARAEAEFKETAAKNEYMRKMAEKSGAGSVEDYVHSIIPIISEKARQNAQNELASMNTDTVKNATTTGLAADKLQSTVPLTTASKLGAPMGGINTGTDYASGRTTPDVAKGSLPTQNVSMAPTMIDPNTGKPMMFSPVTTQGNIPSLFTPGMGTGNNNGIPPMDPSIRAAILNNQSQSGMTPPDNYNPNTQLQPTVPTPANSLGPNGQPTTPNLMDKINNPVYQNVRNPIPPEIMDWLNQNLNPNAIQSFLGIHQ